MVILILIMYLIINWIASLNHELAEIQINVLFTVHITVYIICFYLNQQKCVCIYIYIYN